MEFIEKIQKLKKIHAKSHPDANKQIEEWTERFAELQVKKDWLDHPTTKELKNIALEQIEEIKKILADKEDMSEIERKTLFALKKAHLTYLAILSDDPISEMESIEKSVDEELN